MPTKDIKREKHDCISRFQSHPRRITSTKLKSTPRQQLARAHQKSNHNVLKGYLMTCTGFFGIDAYETGGEKHSKITFVLKNIEEVPAKDDNTEDGE